MEEECEIGIDEAGRGPVLGNSSLISNFLGPMVYGCCFWPIKIRDDMKK
jgi:ribonuclease HII